MPENAGDTQSLGMTTVLRTKKNTIHGIFVIEANPPFHFLEGDKNFSDLTGYTNDADFGREFSTMIHPQDYDRLTSNIKEQLLLSNHTHHRFRLQCAGGEYLSIRVQGDFFRLKDGREILKCSITDFTELDNIAMENLRAKSDLEIFARTIHDGLSKHLCDHQLSLLWANDYFYMLGGYTREEWQKLFASNSLGVIYKKDLASLINKVADITENTSAEMDFRIQCKDGSLKWIHAAAGFSGEIQDNFRVINVILSDITPLMTAERNARIATEQYMILSDISEEIAYEYTFSSDTLTLSRQYKKYFDFMQIIKNPRKQLSNTEYVSDDTREIFMDLLNKILRGVPNGDGEFKIRDKHGKFAWFYTTFSSIIDDNGHLVKIVGLLKNIDSQKQNQEILIRKAQLDNATGLYNKGTTEHFIQKSLSFLSAGQQDALMLIDIDDFKQVNDTFGHLVGDEVILNVAGAMQSVITQNDIAGRIGGDEFAIYFSQVLDTNMLLEKAKSIADTLRGKYPGIDSGAQEKEKSNSGKDISALKVTLSIGIAVASSGTTYETLLNDADTALYSAKLRGKNCSILYNENMERQAYINKRTPDTSAQTHVMSVLYSIIEVLNRAHSTESAVNQVLTYMGTNLPVDKIGVFEYTQDRKYLNCTYQWNKNVLDSSIAKEQGIPAAPFEELYSISSSGIFYSPDTKQIQMINQDAVPDPSYMCQLGVTQITDGSRAMGFISIASTDLNKKWSQELQNLFVWVTHLLGPHIKKKASEETFVSLRETTKLMLDVLPELIYIVDKETWEIIYYNKAFAQVYPDVMPNIKCYKELHNRKFPCSNCPLDSPVRNVAMNQLILEREEKEKYHIDFYPVSWQGLHDSYMMVATPIVEQTDFEKENEQLREQILIERQLAESSFTDTITGYSNFEKFRMDAQNILDSHPKDEYVLVYATIRNFKILNENYGHDVGDHILKTVCDVFNRYSQPDEPFARVISDTFILLRRFTGMEQQLTSFEYICKEVSKACAYVERNFPIHLNGGMLIIDDSDRDYPLNSLIDRAVIAYRSVKHLPQGGFAYYSKELHEKLQFDAHLENSMVDALENGEFLPYLQPKFDIGEKRIIGSEVLVRWKSPQKGFLVPDRFIPLFEKNGFISEIDFYMLEQVCKLMRSYLDRSLTIYPCSVNVSRNTLMQQNFIERVLDIIDEYQIPTENIEFEVTENVFMENTDLVITVLNKLKAHGFSISMDDFGSGYSSLTMLRDLPIDIVKLDKEFLKDSATNDNTYLIMKSVIDMAHAMDIKVVCEGIETEDQAEALDKMGCEIGQGFLFAKPMPVEEYNTMVYPKKK